MTSATSTLRTAGIHHVTAMAGDTQRNVDFYAGTLGLRLVKVTVNFDDPGTYHLYYGNAHGGPGSILTFFPWGDAPRGRTGAGEPIETALQIPAGSQPFWKQRLEAAGIEIALATRFGLSHLLFQDPDGMALSLVESSSAAGLPAAWKGSPANAVDGASAIVGFHSVTLSVAGFEDTAEVLTQLMGMTASGQEGDRFRFTAQPVVGNEGNAAIGKVVDIRCQPERSRGRLGVGSVHHLAFRAADKGQQLAFRSSVQGRGLNVTPVVDRSYFESIYFREPGGVLFEIATDQPGFATDEPANALGQKLMLPAQYESLRPQLKGALPALRLPIGETLP